MIVYKTNKAAFWKNEIINWTQIFILGTILCFAFSFFSSFNKDKMSIGIIVMVLLKLSNFFTQYHIVEIKVDKPNNELTFLLLSRMSGQKIKKYQLDKVNSSFSVNSSWTKIFTYQFNLKILLNAKNFFVITNRYGFTKETLELVDNTLKTKTAFA
jgi:hypothetical protein